MVRPATWRNLEKTGVSNITVLQVGDESIPFVDRSIDVVISNGVINLSPAKENIFREIHRVLKLGGWLQFADIVAEKELPAAMTGSPVEVKRRHDPGPGSTRAA